MHVDWREPKMDNGEDCVSEDNTYDGLCKPEESERKDDDWEYEVDVALNFVLQFVHVFFLQNSTESSQ